MKRACTNDTIQSIRLDRSNRTRYPHLPFNVSMKKNQKQIAIVAGGLLVLYLLYRYYEANNAAAAASGTTGSTTGTDAADYAGLAGQEQSDVAGLQSQNQQLSAQEQSDVQALQSGLAGEQTQESSDVTALASQEQSDVNSLSAMIEQVQTEVQNIPTRVRSVESPKTKREIRNLQKEVSRLAIGEKKGKRGHHARVHHTTPHKPGKKLFGGLPKTTVVKKGTPHHNKHNRRK